ncbi:MAG: DUF1080 domain-containing protein, partial [Armatimonadetes bacterium]|nr:DUF1080 domain-containing protein [Armatimonadota bacterium]
MKRVTCCLITAVIIGASPLFAEPFAEDWTASWTQVLAQNEGSVRRLLDGSLEIDPAPKGYIYWYGGEQLHDFSVTVRFKFLRADDKYSGLSVFLRWNGAVWGERDGYWIYLRPKFRSLYMSKIMDGRLDKTFDDYVEAVRPKATPIGEWMTLRCEAVGRQIRVYLNDELHLSATDEGMFPILSGRVAFGAGDAHVVVADISQQNLEMSEHIRGVTYRYINKPDRGDENATILTDGKVNSR